MKSDDLTPVWKALADPARRRILDLLRVRPRTTGEIGRHFEFTRYATMKHLAVLLGAGLILVRREGRSRWNYLNPVPLQAVYNRWLKPYEAVWAGALLELKGCAELTFAREEAMKDPRQMPKNGGIRIEQELKIAAPRPKVFHALTHETGKWWPFRVNKELAVELVLEPRVGGRFYESWGGDQGILWGNVLQIRHDERLDLVGMCGMARLAYSFISFTLEPDGEGTLLKLSHRGMGELDEDVERDYGKGWKHLLETAFRNWVEKGEPPEIQG